MKKAVAIICLVVAWAMLVACDKTKPVNKNDFDPTKLTYFQDKRTELCFAAVLSTRLSSSASYAENVIMTHVPCNDEVLNLVGK